MLTIKFSCDVDLNLHHSDYYTLELSVFYIQFNPLKIEIVFCFYRKNLFHFASDGAKLETRAARFADTLEHGNKKTRIEPLALQINNWVGALCLGRQELDYSV